MRNLRGNRRAGPISRTERLGMALSQAAMGDVLRRLGDRVVELRDAYEAVTGGVDGRKEARCDDLTKLFWNCGVDDAEELVHDYGNLLRELDPGDASSTPLSLDDFLRLYDYHERSVLGDAGGTQMLGVGRSTLRPASEKTNGTSGPNKVGPGHASRVPPSVLTAVAQGITINYGADYRPAQSNGTASGIVGERSAPPQQQQALRAAFDKYDVDKDGLISFIDLRTRFREMGKTNVPDLEIRRWIADKDRRGAGNVSFAEFSRAYQHVVGRASAGDGRYGGGVARLGGVGLSTSDSNAQRPAYPGSTGGRRDDGFDGRARKGELEVRGLRDTIVAGRRAERELEMMEKKELLRLMGDNQTLLVRARAAFDRFDRTGRGFVRSNRLQDVLEHMGYSTPTLARDVRAWETEFWNKAGSAVDMSQRSLEFRDFAAAFAEICGGQVRAHDNLDRIAQAQARRRAEVVRREQASRLRSSREYKEDSNIEEYRSRPRNRDSSRASRSASRRDRSSSRDRRSPSRTGRSRYESTTSDDYTDETSDVYDDTEDSEPERRPYRGGRRYVASSGSSSSTNVYSRGRRTRFS